MLIDGSGSLIGSFVAVVLQAVSGKASIATHKLNDSSFFIVYLLLKNLLLHHYHIFERALLADICKRTYALMLEWSIRSLLSGFRRCFGEIDGVIGQQHKR